VLHKKFKIKNKKPSQGHQHCGRFVRNAASQVCDLFGYIGPSDGEKKTKKQAQNLSRRSLLLFSYKAKCDKSRRRLCMGAN
jgi:hypothetical protein